MYIQYMHITYHAYVHIHIYIFRYFSVQTYLMLSSAKSCTRLVSYMYLHTHTYLNMHMFIETYIHDTYILHIIHRYM